MEEGAMWLKIYVFIILMIIFLTLLWYFRELRREKAKLKSNAKIDKKEPLFERIEIEQKAEFSAIDFNEPKAMPTPSYDQILPEESIKLEIRAYPDQPYMGYELLQSLLAAGFRYGEMNVFNRYDEEGKRVLFSLGVSSPTHSFELSTMGGFSCSGLIVSMPLEGRDLLRIFDLMLNTSAQLIEDLGGELLDEQQNPVNDEIVAAWRSRLKVFEGKQNSV